MHGRGMEKKYVTSCLSHSLRSLLHIWPLNYSCWKRGEIYSDLDRVSDWARSPVPLPHTALEPWAHMGAIICKVAAVAPGNDLKGACVHLCACVCLVMCGAHGCIYSPLSHPPISSKWRGKSAACRRGDTGRLLCCLNPKLSRPPFSPWKRIIFSSIVKHLSEMFTHARTLHTRTLIPLWLRGETLPHVFTAAVDTAQLWKPQWHMWMLMNDAGVHSK